MKEGRIMKKKIWNVNISIALIIFSYFEKRPHSPINICICHTYYILDIYNIDTNAYVVTLLTFTRLA